MVSCKHCSTPNSLDSTFCKRCGTALPAEDVQIAQEKLTALIAEGNTAFNEGKTDEAMAIAESAIASNPSSTAALSLKSLCHERRGELAEALECADLIVDLNPDSELDKIKRNQLRTKLSVSVQLATAPPDRRSAVIGAVATVVLVVCLGIGAAKFSNRGTAAKADGLVAQNPPISPVNTTQLSGPSSNPSSAQQIQASAPPKQQTIEEPPTPDEGQQRSFSRQGPGILPRQGDGGITGEIRTSEDPLLLNNPKTSTSTTVNPPIVTPTSGSGTKPGQGDGGQDPPPTPESKVQPQNTDPGQIEIKVSNGSRSAGSIGSASLGAGGVAALIKVGVTRYQLGSYGAAASSFDQALRAGGDQVTVNQWLGRCYGSMGRKSEEIDAYKRCVIACQSAISNGGGNKDRIKAIMDTCQQELKVLQGN